MELSCKQAAKLVLGYLKSENCIEAHHEFLRTCRHLRDVNKKPGKYILTRIQGMTLIDILSDYARVYTIVQERLDDTDFFNDRHHSIRLAHQLLYLLDNHLPSRCSTPNFLSRCATPQRSFRQDFFPLNIQPSSDIDATPLKSLPGNADGVHASPKNKVPLPPSSRSRSNSDTESDTLDENGANKAIQAFAQSLLKQQDLQEKLADNINQARCTDIKEKVKDGTACDDIDSAIKAVLDKTESDPVFDTLMGEIIGSVNTAQHFPEKNILETVPSKNDQFIPSCFDPAPAPVAEPVPAPAPTPQPTNAPTMTNTIQQQQSQPTEKTDAPRNVPGEIIVYEGSLESYMKSGAGGTVVDGEHTSRESSTADGHKSKQKGKQLLFISNTPFNIVPQHPTQIKLSETDIITMPTVIVCDDNAKIKPKPVKKVPAKPEKKLKTLPPKTPTLSEYITLYKCNDDDSNSDKTPEIKTLKTVHPKKSTLLRKIDPPKIEIQVLNEQLGGSKTLQTKTILQKGYPSQPTTYAPPVSNFTPLVQDNQYEPQVTQTNFVHDPPVKSNQQATGIDANVQKSLTFASTSDVMLATTSNVSQVQTNLIASTSNISQIQTNILTSNCNVNQVQTDLLASTGNMYQAQSDNNANQVLIPTNKQSQAQIIVGDATNNINQITDSVFPSTNNAFASVNANNFTPVINTNQPAASVNANHRPTAPNQFAVNQIQSNLLHPIENQNLNKCLQSVHNQSIILKSIQNQNELIQSAQNDQTISNEVPGNLKITNMSKANNRKVTITDVIDVDKLTGEKSTENEVKKKEVTPGDKAEKRKSASTPRSGNKSHVRALDFKFHTPAKDVLDVKSLSTSPAKKKTPAKAKTAKSLFANPLPGSNPIIKKKELIKPKPANSWDAELRALTCTDPAVKNPPPKPKPKPKRQPAKPKAEPKGRKKPPAADNKKNNAKSEESNMSNDKEESDRPSKRTRSKSVKSPQKVITVTTDPHNNECVSIVESEGKVEDLLKSNEAKAATDSENQAHSQINLIKCNSKPRYNKKCNIDNATRKDSFEEINENTASNSIVTKFLTPEFVQPKSNEFPSAKKNIMPMLETPVKSNCPNTPRPRSPTTIEDTPFTKVFKESFNDIDLNNIQTPKFLDTPNFALTPLLEGKSPPSQRGTDYSTSSSYYQPSDTEQNKCLESYIKEECKRAQKRITPIKVEEPMELETDEINSKIHSNEEQLELVCNNKTSETTHKAIAEKMKSLSNNVIARKNLNLVNRKIVSTDESSSEDTDTTDTSDSSDTTSSDDDTIIKNKSRDNSTTRYSLRTSKGNSSKELSEPPEEDIKSILNVTEYTPALPVINVEDAEAKKKAQLLAEMELKRKRTIEIFKNGKPPPKKRAPAKPKKSPVKKDPPPVKRNLRSSARKKPTPVASPKDNVLKNMGLALTSSDEDDLQPLQVVETELLSSSKSNTPVPEARPLANFEQTLKDLSNKKESEPKETELPKNPARTTSVDDDKEAQNLVDGLKERGIYLMHKKTNKIDVTKGVKPEDKVETINLELEEGEVVSDCETKNKPVVVNKKKKLNPAPKIPPPRSRPSNKSRERNKEKKNDADNKSRERRQEENTGGEKKGRTKTKETNVTRKVGNNVVEKPKDLEPPMKKVEMQKSEQTRRKSIHLEQKIEQLKNKKSHQPKNNSDSDTAKKSQFTQEKKTTKAADASEETVNEKFDPIDVNCGEDVDFDFADADHNQIIEYTYNPSEDHRTITWDKGLLRKQRAVDIFVDAVGKNITRPIVLQCNDDIFNYRSSQKRRASIHIIEDLKLQSRKKPLNVLYNDLVTNEEVDNLSTKSPLDQLYSNESKHYSQSKMPRQLQNNDRIQGNRVTKRPDVVKKTTVEKEVKKTTVKKEVKSDTIETGVKNATIEKDVIAECAPSCSKNITDYSKPSVYSEVPSTPDQAEYDSLMDYSLVLSGTKRKAESGLQKITKKQKPYISNEMLRKVDVDAFLNIIHNPM